MITAILGYFLLYLMLSLILGIGIGRCLKARNQHQVCADCSISDEVPHSPLPSSPLDFVRTIILTCHPSTPCPLIQSLEIQATRDSGRFLALRYRVTGEIADLALPLPEQPERTHGLWNHTCFEAFLRGHGAEGYFELNFSPSTCWAVYHFDSYRTGMTTAGTGRPPAISVQAGERELELTALIDLSDLAPGLQDADLNLAVSAVIESRTGEISYWAYQHPAGKPDFHHPDGFALDLSWNGVASAGA